MTTTDASVRIGVHPLTVRIGAEITGVDAGEPQSDETIAEVRAALVRHSVGDDGAASSGFSPSLWWCSILLCVLFACVVCVVAVVVFCFGA